MGLLYVGTLDIVVCSDDTKELKMDGVGRLPTSRSCTDLEEGTLSKKK